MDDDQQFCLRWNNHQSTLVSVFDTLLVKEIHVDCTLAAEGRTLKAHKVVLSACSPYFESVLSEQFDKHPIIILKDVKFAELRAMMDYMYRGEVNISQDQLAALLKAAESLQIKGLSDNKPSRPPSRPPPPPAHPPRAPSPPPQTRDGSSDSRSGSLSPSRRRKKARRTSSPAPAPPAPPSPEPCKEELSRDVEDLTLDDAHTPPADQNDVVRNFQWHMERSQDEIMNSNDSVRETQGRRATPRHSIMTRSKKVSEETSFATTLAILKNVNASDVRYDVKENDARTAAPKVEPRPEPAPEPEPEPEPKAEPEAEPKTEPEPRYHVFPRGPQQLPCAQYKTEKGYRCPNCQRCYNARKNLVRHVTLECGREPQYKCPHCDYKLHKDSLPSLLSLLSAQRPGLPQLLQHALFKPKEDPDSEPEYDDTDDIVLPEEPDAAFDVFPGPGPDADGKPRRDDDDASRQFECRHCGKRYRWKSTLRRHENVECGGKPPAHQCPYCAYRAKQRGNLGVHIRKHHNTEWYIYATSKVRRNKKTSV